MQKIIFRNGGRRNNLVPDAEQYRRMAERAASLGATHMYVTPVLKSIWQWDSDRADPYPNWQIRHATLFKICLPKLLMPYMPKEALEHAKINQELVAGRAAVLKEFGLRAAYNGCDPAYLPEAVFRAFPSWRGPRCDQPRRSTKEYYSPCCDVPEVRELFKSAMAELCGLVPVEYMNLLTNDCGGGTCWSENLYSGKNGPAACAHIGLAERVTNFLSALQEGAAMSGVKLEVGYNGIFRPFEIDAITPSLKEGQYIYQRARNNNVADFSVNYEADANPVIGLPDPLCFADEMQAVKADYENTITINMPLTDGGEAEAFFKKGWRKIGPGPLGRINLLNDVAEQYVGAEFATDLAEVWAKIRSAVSDQFMIRNGCQAFWVGGVQERLLTRPFVPFQNELTPEEKDYYREYQFTKCLPDKDSDNLMNFQGAVYIRGYSGWFLIDSILDTAENHLKKGLECLDRVLNGLPAEHNYRRELVVLKFRIRALICVYRNLVNAAEFQSVLDLTDRETPPSDKYEVWYMQGDELLYRIKAAFRREIDNTVELIDILENSPAPVFQLSADKHDEDILMLGCDIVDQLKKKIRIMEDHRGDFNRVYMNFNR